MTLRICDNGNRRVFPASLEAVELAFAPGEPYSEGTEITMADGERYLTAIVVAGAGDPGEFFVSGYLGGAGLASDRVGRGEALRRFRRFLVAV